MKREMRRYPYAKAALTLDQLKRILSELGSSTQHDVRTRALWLVGFASGMRRSELSALDIADVSITDEGLRLQLRRSKGDQFGEGRHIGIWAAKEIGFCPVDAMQQWLALRGTAPGTLFCKATTASVLHHRTFTGQGMHKALQRAVASVGANPVRYGAHSLRAGFVTASVQAGASVVSIMQRTGHKSVQMLQRYVRPASVFDVDPFANVL